MEDYGNLMGMPPRPPLPTMHDLPGVQMAGSNPLTSMPGPRMATLPTAPQRPSLWQRIQGVLMPNTGMAGLLGEDGVSDARKQGLLHAGLDMLGNSQGVNGGNAPGIGAILSHGIQAGQGAYQGDVEHQISGGLAAQDIAQKQQILARRNQIGASFPPAPNETPQQQVMRLMKMFTAYSQAGDTEMAGKLGEVLKSMGDVMQGPKPVDLQHVDAGDHIEVIDPRTGRTIRTMPKGAAPKTPSDVTGDMKFQADQKNKILDDYARDTKDFHQVMAGWDVLQGATKDPSLATPFAITDAYARITNPGAVVRPTTMEMIDHMGSVGQRMKKFWAHNADGQLPPDIMRDFQRTLYNIVREHKNQYDKIRKQALTRASQSGVSGVDALLQDYDITDPLAPTTPAGGKAAGSAANVRQFLKP